MSTNANGIQTKLTREQRHAVGLLSVGTFLEYFDLMLYVHMAVLLNELFFPKTDPHTASLLSAFAFCSVFVLRPVGAFIFGWIGDNIGRKPIVIITAFLMSASCVVMATLPTYAQIGISASIAVTVCRMIQGMSSMGEIISAEVYLTELVKPPIQFPAVMMIAIASIIGGTVALGVASFAINYGMNWRIAFWIGTAIALVGTIARTSLKESKDFASASHILKSKLEDIGSDITQLKDDKLLHESLNKKTALAFFLLQCGWPVCFYLTYVYCSNALKNNFGYSSEEVIYHNFYVSLFNFFGYIVLFILSFKIHPLKLLKAKVLVFLPVILFFPYLLSTTNNPNYIFLMQAFIMLFVLSHNPAVPILYKYIPLFKRMTSGGMMYALSRALMHIITSFGMIYCEKYFGYYGMLIIVLPVAIAYIWGVNYFQSLEQKVYT